MPRVPCSCLVKPSHAGPDAASPRISVRPPTSCSSMIEHGGGGRVRGVGAVSVGEGAGGGGAGGGAGRARPATCSPWADPCAGVKKKSPSLGEVETQGC